MSNHIAKIEPSLTLFNSLSSVSAIQKLIDGGESENQYIECKSPTAPRLSGGLKFQLSRAVSGFANSGGGVIIWGVSTTRHQHTSLDILTQIEQIGSVKKFAQEIDSEIPRLIKSLTIELYQSQVLLKKTSDTKGMIITYISPTTGDPIQASDGKFYLRIRDEFKEMPYETIKRMFSGTASPDLYPIFDNRLVKLEQDGSWKIPIILENRSSAAARDTEVSVTITNFSACESVNSAEFRDSSNINPGRKIFMADINKPIHRGMNILAGNLTVKMKKLKLPKRILNLVITVYASNMRARQRLVTVQLAKNKGFSVKNARDEYLY